MDKFDYCLSDAKCEMFHRDRAVALESVVDGELLAKLQMASERARDYPMDSERYPIVLQS
jgi:hypothetical protein